MRILFASSQLIFRETRFGGAKRLYLFARELSKHHEVDILCMDGCGEIGNFPPPGHREFPRLLALPGADAKQGLEPWITLPVDARGGIRRAMPEISSFVAGRPYDATLLAYPFALSILSVLPESARRNVTYMEDDLWLEIMRKRMAEPVGSLRRFSRALRYRQALALYRNLLRPVSRFVAISREEEAIMQRHFPRLETHVVGYGIDLADLPLLPITAPKAAGFIGNFRHLSNRDALAHLLERLWPAIRAELPDASLVVAGPGLPEDLRDRLVRAGGAEYLGEVGDLRDFYGRIGIFINPIVSARGMRTKLVEAAAFGRPIVSTALGAEGFEGMRVDLAETPEQFIAAMACVGGTGSAVSENRRRVEQAYSVQALTRRLEGIFGFHVSERINQSG